MRRDRYERRRKAENAIALIIIAVVVALCECGVMIYIAERW